MTTTIESYFSKIPSKDPQSENKRRGTKTPNFKDKGRGAKEKQTSKLSNGNKIVNYFSASGKKNCKTEPLDYNSRKSIENENFIKENVTKIESQNLLKSNVSIHENYE